MKVKLIACVAKNGVIGNKGKMPWRFIEEINHFKETTKSFPLICGHNTSILLPRGLKHNWFLEIRRDDVNYVHTLEQAIERCRQFGFPECYIIGGGKLYKEALDKCLVDEMIISYLPTDYEGDTYFPAYAEVVWEEYKREKKEGFEVVYYKHCTESKVESAMDRHFSNPEIRGVFERLKDK